MKEFIEREVSKRGVIGLPSSIYGHSVDGIPLKIYLPKSGKAEILIFASIHGQEPETTLLLSKVLRSLPDLPEKSAFILAANPDGLLAGTRTNANGVDLNRNFPAKNWSTEPYLDYWLRKQPKNIPLSTGSHPGSEPETKALIQVIEDLKPKHIIALHGPLDCVDDPLASDLGKWMSKCSNMKLVTEIGYTTTGSFGSWCADKNLHVITYELPSMAAWDMIDINLPIFQKLACYGAEAVKF